MTAVRSFKIPEENIKTFTERVERLNVRAAKLGVDPIVVTFANREPRSRTLDNGKQHHFWVVPGEVSLTTVKLNGWSFVGKLVHLHPHPQVVVLNAPGETTPEEFRNAAPTCDHCQKQRHRNETFVLRHDSGTHKRVGRQCLRDFLGHESSDYLAARAEYLLDASQLVVDAEDEESFGPTPFFCPEVIEYMTAAATVIRLNGWVSSSAAREHGCESTAQQAWVALYAKDPAVLKHYEASDEDKVAAAEALRWGKALSEKPHLTDYEHNVSAALQPPCVHRTTLGIIASAVALSQREKERLHLAAKARPTLNSYFASVGERVTFQGYLERTKDVQSTFTLSVLHQLRTLDGHVLTWFCTGKPLDPSDEARTFTARVKGHRLFNGLKQTTVSRLVESAELPKQKRERASKKKAA